MEEQYLLMVEKPLNSYVIERNDIKMNTYKMSNDIEISSEIELSNEMIKKVETKVYEENNFTFDGITKVELVKSENSINVNIITADIERIRRITGLSLRSSL